jgi:hypothetical protein
MAELSTTKLDADLRVSLIELRCSIAEVRHALEIMALQLQLRFGVMCVVAIALVAILRFTKQL